MTTGSDDRPARRTAAPGDPWTAALEDETGPLARSLRLFAAHRVIILERAGEMLTHAEAAARLAISPEAVDARREANRLLGVREGADWLYPAFQFGPQDQLELLPLVLEAYAGSEPVGVLDILLAPDTSLGGRSLLEAIREGDRAAVERHLNQIDSDGFS